jgi:hypothetical protein
MSKLSSYMSSDWKSFCKWLIHYTVYSRFRNLCSKYSMRTIFYNWYSRNISYISVPILGKHVLLTKQKSLHSRTLIQYQNFIWWKIYYLQYSFGKNLLLGFTAFKTQVTLSNHVGIECFIFLYNAKTNFLNFYDNTIATHKLTKFSTF